MHSHLSYLVTSKKVWSFKYFPVRIEKTDPWPTLIRSILGRDNRVIIMELNMSPDCWLVTMVQLDTVFQLLDTVFQLLDTVFQLLDIPVITGLDCLKMWLLLDKLQSSRENLLQLPAIHFILFQPLDTIFMLLDNLFILLQHQASLWTKDSILDLLDQEDSNITKSSSTLCKVNLIFSFNNISNSLTCFSNKCLQSSSNNQLQWLSPDHS